MNFWAKMGSVPLNSCEPARPADTNAAPVVHLRAYLFAASLDKVPEYSKEVYFHRSESFGLSVIFQAGFPTGYGSMVAYRKRCGLVTFVLAMGYLIG
ncbi:hypothetical protein Tco_0617618, partial [Tanacetum coccineum]